MVTSVLEHSLQRSKVGVNVGEDETAHIRLSAVSPCAYVQAPMALRVGRSAKP